MVDISSGDKKINITVSTSGNKASVNATPDTAMYYSNKSREWAISDKIVDNEDYSAKYYAQQAAQGNVQANWNETDVNAKSYILNKPTKLSDFTDDLIPSQKGQTGKFLKTDGTSTLWENVDALPPQTGNNGKVLTTDGTNADWDNIIIFRKWS